MLFQFFGKWTDVENIFNLMTMLDKREKSGNLKIEIWKFAKFFFEICLLKNAEI